MKKTIYFLAIFATIVLLTAACKSTDVSDAGTTGTQTAGAGTTAQTQDTQQTQEPEEVTIPADTYTIKATDSSEKFIMKYRIDPNNRWKISSATFEMRNFGDKPIIPEVNFIVGTAGAVGELKKFEYDAIPPGYKMSKQETVNMNVEDEHVYIKGTLTDKSTGKELGSVNFDYFAG